jgi:hypothetical protein
MKTNEQNKPERQTGQSTLNTQPSTAPELLSRSEQVSGNPLDSQLSTLNSQLVYAYSRSQAIADGLQIEVTKTAQEAGIRFPVFLTRGAYNLCVAVPPGVIGQDEAGRLWDVVWMLRFAIIRSQPGTTRLNFALYVRNSNSHPARLTKLIATAGAVDIDDPAPAITIMLPDED